MLRGAVGKFRALALESLAGRGLLASVLCAVLMRERSVEYSYLYLDVDIYLEWVAVAIASRPGARGHGARRVNLNPYNLKP